jgi:hypothetical protein
MNTIQSKQPDGPSPDAALERLFYMPFRDGTLCFLELTDLAQIVAGLERHHKKNKGSSKPKVSALLENLRAIQEKINRSKTALAILKRKPPLPSPENRAFDPEGIWSRHPLIHVVDRKLGLGVLLDRETLVGVMRNFDVLKDMNLDDVLDEGFEFCMAETVLVRKHLSVEEWFRKRGMEILPPDEEEHEN